MATVVRAAWAFAWCAHWPVVLKHGTVCRKCGKRLQGPPQGKLLPFTRAA